MNVNHKDYGEGEVIRIYGQNIEVKFGDIYGFKIFSYPHAFKETLTTQDQSLRIKVNKALNRAGMGNPKFFVNQMEDFELSILGKKASKITFENDDELFDVIGYLSTPGRIEQIWAEVPNDKTKIFRHVFPNQNIIPIEQGETPAGNASKFGCQFRIFLNSITEAPQVLLDNKGAGLGKCVARINRSNFVAQLVSSFRFNFGKASDQDYEAIEEMAKESGHYESYVNGKNRPL